MHEAMHHVLAPDFCAYVQRAGRKPWPRWKLDMIEPVLARCEWCRKHKRGKLRPKMAVSLTRCFNDLIASDLSELVPEEQSKYLFACIIDLHTRYSECPEAKDFSGETYVELVMCEWVNR